MLVGKLLSNVLLPPTSVKLCVHSVVLCVSNICYTENHRDDTENHRGLTRCGNAGGVILSETKYLKRFFATLRMTRGEFRMTKGNDSNNVIAPFRGLGVD